MSNVISFQKALEDRKSYQENKEKIDALIHKRSKTFRDFYAEQAKSDFLAESYPLLSMFFKTVNESFEDPRFAEGLLTLAAIIEPDGDIIVDGKELTNCLRLYNSYNGKDFPNDSATVLALGTEHGIRTLMKLEVKTLLEEADQYNIQDIREVRQLFYDYMNEHPDVDTERDTLGNLSVLSYQAISTFIENGYSFSRYFFGLVREEEKHRFIPTPILMEFTKQTEVPIYLYYDYEAAMRSFEAMIEDIFGEE